MISIARPLTPYTCVIFYRNIAGSISYISSREMYIWCRIIEQESYKVKTKQTMKIEIKPKYRKRPCVKGLIIVNLQPCSLKHSLEYDIILKLVCDNGIFSTNFKFLCRISCKTARLYIRRAIKVRWFVKFLLTTHKLIWTTIKYID